ncbi:putative aldehyde oxidase Art an 7 [Lactuca sativa]|uniref:Galactose oxidase-like Early set domain-containing protein n=1 Tax=Lactuca sativa TaxID=4236 RepID=A0A9R1UKI4_LACSA|nr:putative aldehyde oxidase Art an 7 [Lactuca sativa]KAJ0189217.1 hypothetical protein LSAT_V11C800427040 [Lactuca sativa]
MAHIIKTCLGLVIPILFACSLVVARDIADGGNDQPGKCNQKPDQPQDNSNPIQPNITNSDQPDNPNPNQPQDNPNAIKPSIANLDQPDVPQADQPHDNPNPIQPNITTPDQPDNPNPDQPQVNPNITIPDQPDNPNPDKPQDNPNPIQPNISNPDQPDNPNPGQPQDNPNPVQPDIPNPDQPPDNPNPDQPNNPNPDQPQDNPNPDQPGDNQKPGIDQPTDPNAAVADGGSDYTAPPLETGFLGEWVIDNPNAGVAAMQLQLMPNDKLVWYDTTSLGPSGIKMQPEGNCPINPDAKNQPDCYAHAIAYDWRTSAVRTLTLQGDAWCSSGNLWPNGNLAATGGTATGDKAIRMIPNNDDPKADFETRLNVLADVRWYASNVVLPDGSAVVLGGRGSFSYEIVPPSLDFKPRRFDMPFLKETTTPDLGPGRPVENNLYPFQFLLPDGNIFLYANNRAICFEPQTGNVVREYPELAGGSRNYPPSGQSALLPLKLTADNKVINTEVVICGGNSPDAYKVVDARHVTEKQFMPALRDCHRIQPLNQDATWTDEEQMPSGRVMGDLLDLPNADLLMLNGAQSGTSGWEDATDANLTPLLYSPTKPMGNRFKPLNPTTIARMYHSCSALLPDTRILVAGSNMHQFYTFDTQFPTELRVEKFSPPYLDPALDPNRPIIDAKGSDLVLQYGKPFKIAATLQSNETMVLGEIMVTMVYPPFTTHGFSQNQRLLIPALTSIENNVINAVAPGGGTVAPPGYYMLFVNRLGVPGPSVWVHIE